MRAIALKCPNCHANLEAAETAHSITCTYCGTQARVQHRTRYLERKIALPPPRPAERKMPVAKQRHGWRWVSLVGSIIPLTTLGLGGYFAFQEVGGMEGVGNAISEATEAVIGNRATYGGQGSPLLYDVNGDGVLDIIGTLRYVQNNDSYHLAAFDGRGGQQLWESESFGNHADAMAGKTILHTGTIVQGDSRGNLAGYAAETGLQLWKVPVGEKLKDTCADDEVSLALLLNDKSRKRILLSDGSLSELVEEPQDCKRVATLEVRGQPNLRYASDDSRTRRVRLKIDGMAVSDLVTLVDQPGQQVAMGNKSPGTRIPMVAYLRTPSSESDAVGDEDATTKKRKSRKRSKVNRAPKPELVWSSELPALDPLSTKEGPTKFVGISQGYIAAMYSPKDGAPHLVCFSREGGQRLWDVAMPGRTSVVTGIEISGDRIYVTQWGRLDAFELERGSHVFAIGD